MGRVVVFQRAVVLSLSIELGRTAQPAAAPLQRDPAKGLKVFWRAPTWIRALRA